jgi:hypothetical protein
MKLFSLVLCILASFGIFLALSMDTSVATSYGRVHNVGLVSDRQIYIIASALFLLIGVILFGFSTLRPASNQQPFARTLLIAIAISTAIVVGIIGVSIGVYFYSISTH